MSRKTQRNKKKIKRGRGPTVKLRPRQDVTMHEFKDTSIMKTSNKKTKKTVPVKSSRISVSKTTGKQTKRMGTLTKLAETILNKKAPEFTISYIKEIQKELNEAFYG